MSAPNKSYDPVAVAALAPDEVAGRREEAIAAISAAADLEELKRVRLEHAGDRSPLALANREIRALPPAARAEAGKRVGEARKAVAEALKARQAELEDERDQRVLVEEAVDVTLPTGRVPRGARHPLTTLQERMADVFVGLGFEVAEGLAAADSGLGTRTRTWPGRLRAPLSRPLPLHVVIPGEYVRTGEPVATHGPVCHQMDVLVVDEGVGMADLRGGIDAFVRGMFGADATARIRPSYVPSTSPSAKVDVRCPACGGTGCPACRSASWVELGGGGVVDPRVLAAAGVDTGRYSGWAFGIGVERTLMLRHGVEETRDMVEGDVRFTLPFGVEV